MKRMKQAVSWLLVLVMMISLIPANLARAEGETVEVQEDFELGSVLAEQNDMTNDSENFFVTLPNLNSPDAVTQYGYEIYDAYGEIPLDFTENSGFTVEPGGSLTFLVKPVEGVINTIEYGLYVGAEELVATEMEDGSRSYTISNITDDIWVEVYTKYAVSMSDSSVKFIPCTLDGTELVSEGVSEYYFRSYSAACFKLDAGAMTYQIKNGDEIISTDDSGLYWITLEDAPITLTTTKYYSVNITCGEENGLGIGNEEIQYEFMYNEEEDITYYYTADNFIFDIIVWSAYNGDNMTVTIKYEDGTTEELTRIGHTTNEDEYGEIETIYSFETGTLTQNAEIIVEGIYSTDTSELVLHYDREAMDALDVDVKVLDANEEELEMTDYFSNIVYYSVNSGRKYTLTLSGAEETLSNLKVTADGQTLTGTVSNGVWKADITKVSSIYIANGDQYYINYSNVDDVGYIYVTEYGTQYTTYMRGYYPAGSISFWIDEDSEIITAQNAYVVAIKDSNGQNVTYTKRDNVEVDDYGTKRTVYTVNLASDILIEIAGGEYIKYDVYLPAPGQNDGYTIGSLYTMEEAVNGDGEWCEKPVEMAGVADITNGCTKYPSVPAETTVYFDVTTAASNGTPYVQIAKNKYLYPQSEPVELENSMMKYTYSFCVNSMADVDISVNTETILVEAIGSQDYIVQYDEAYNVWNIYDEDPDAEPDETIWPVLEIYDLPRVIDKNDTEHQYNIQYYLEWTLDVEDYNKDLLFTAKKADGTTKALNMFYEDGDGLTEYYNMPVQEGYYTLVVDMDKIEPRNAKITLTSYRDDMEISIAGEEGTDYKVVAGKEDTYKAVNQQLTFSVTAENAAEFDAEDFFLGTDGYMWDGTYTESDDKLTRTYTITDAWSSGDISVSYVATVDFDECENGGIESEYLGQGGGYDEDGNLVRGTYAAGSLLGLHFFVDDSYDAQSVKVIQKYIDAEGNEQVTEYTDFEGGNRADGQDDFCTVRLQPGLNTFSITPPKKKSYTMNLPNSVAYTIELVNGSKTTVNYLGTFSFKIKANASYDLSNIVVTANGQKMTPDANGIYTIKNVREDYEIGITGYKTSKHLVTFKDYDGKVLKIQTVDHGKAATAPANPTRKGYSFTGWNTTFTKVTKDMTVTATYKQILVTKLKITGDSTALAVGKTMKLTATATPTDALNKDVVWTTSNKKYATVSSTGKVKALKKGAGKTVKITATAKDGSGVKATYKIKIYKNTIKKIKLTAKTKTVKAGKKVTVKATLTPSKNVFKTLQWSSSNKKWATVNSKGVVTTKKAGKGKTVKITAKAMDGSNKKAIIKIKIKK